MSPDGRVVDRTAVSEQRVLKDTITRRQGETLATRVGDLPVLLIAVGLMLAAHLLDRRSRRRVTSGAEDHVTPDSAPPAGSVGA